VGVNMMVGINLTMLVGMIACRHECSIPLDVTTRHMDWKKQPDIDFQRPLGATRR